MAPLIALLLVFIREGQVFRHQMNCCCKFQCLRYKSLLPGSKAEQPTHRSILADTCRFRETEHLCIFSCRNIQGAHDFNKLANVATLRTVYKGRFRHKHYQLAVTTPEYPITRNSHQPLPLLGIRQGRLMMRSSWEEDFLLPIAFWSVVVAMIDGRVEC